MARTSIDVLRQHIYDICEGHDITVVDGSSYNARAWKKNREIRIRPVKTSNTYAVALHEIGHILGKWQSKPRLIAEAGAWLWARQHALEWNDQMESKLRKSLTSYLKWARLRQHRKRPPVIPTPTSHPQFWQVFYWNEWWGKSVIKR